MTIKTKLKAGGVRANHNQGGQKLKSAAKAGGRNLQHNQTPA